MLPEYHLSSRLLQVSSIPSCLFSGSRISLDIFCLHTAIHYTLLLIVTVNMARLFAFQEDGSDLENAGSVKEDGFYPLPDTASELSDGDGQYFEIEEPNPPTSREDFHHRQFPLRQVSHSPLPPEVFRVLSCVIN